MIQICGGLHKKKSPKFNWNSFIEYLDKADEDCFFGQPITKPEWIYQVNLSRHADLVDIQPRALETLQAFFGPRIPDVFHNIAYKDNETLRDKMRPINDLRCYGGWFVGIRNNSHAAWYLNDLYQTHEDLLSDDEGLFALLFYAHPEIKQYQALQGAHEPKPSQIEQTSLLNYKGIDKPSLINIGVQEFYMDEYKAERRELAEYFAGYTFEKHAEITQPAREAITENETGDLTIPAAELNVFGQHIIGTYAIGSDQHVFPLLTQSDRSHATMYGFPAALPPITDPLRQQNDIESPEIAIIYCLFHNKPARSHDLHVYAKSMIYAFKMHIKNTNILELGKIFMFVDERIMGIVEPYCRAAGISQYIVPFFSNMEVQYAAYLPCLWHEKLQQIPIRLYFDVDMWWINLHNAPQFDYNKLIHNFRGEDGEVLGATVPKTPEWITQDLYGRSVAEGDMHIEKTKKWVKDTFNNDIPNEIRAITGCHNGIRAGETLNKLKLFYTEVHEFIRDDEALWAMFLTLNPNVEIKRASDILPSTSFRADQAENQKESALSHVGTYVFEHFFGKPYAQKFYEHCLND